MPSVYRFSFVLAHIGLPDADTWWYSNQFITLKAQCSLHPTLSPDNSLGTMIL